MIMLRLLPAQERKLIASVYRYTQPSWVELAKVTHWMELPEPPE